MLIGQYLNTTLEIKTLFDMSLNIVGIVVALLHTVWYNVPVGKPLVNVRPN